VITAFIIESYQGLQEDNTATSAAILRRISIQLEANMTALPLEPLPGKFKATNSTVVVNVLWFSGLMLSLFASLFGIFVKQWLRVYSKWDEETSIKAAMEVRTLYHGGFSRWRVLDIVAALPVMLQGALVLFAVGMMVYLWTIDHIVAAVLSALLLMLLALASITISLPLIFTDCPYKSPLGLFLASAISGYHYGWLKVQQQWISLRSEIGNVASSGKLRNHLHSPSNWKERDLVIINLIEKKLRSPVESILSRASSLLGVSTESLEQDLDPADSDSALLANHIRKIEPDVCRFLI
jgi:hypothetical protein